MNDADATAREAVALGGRQVMPPTDIPGVGRFPYLASPEGVLLYAITHAMPRLPGARCRIVLFPRPGCRDEAGRWTSRGRGMFCLLIRERNPNALEAFFATHPLAEDRIAVTQALIATYSPNQLRNLRRDAESFEAFRRRLLALPPPPPAGKQP